MRRIPGSPDLGRTWGPLTRCVLFATAHTGLLGTVCDTSDSSDLTDDQWALLEPVFNTPGKRGSKHAPDLRRVVDAMLHVSHTGCQWRVLARVVRALDEGVVRWSRNDSTPRGPANWGTYVWLPWLHVC